MEQSSHRPDELSTCMQGLRESLEVIFCLAEWILPSYFAAFQSRCSPSPEVFSLASKVVGWVQSEASLLELYLGRKTRPARLVPCFHHCSYHRRHLRDTPSQTHEPVEGLRSLAEVRLGWVC